MNPLAIALVFVGSWLLIGLGLLGLSNGARSLVAIGASGRGEDRVGGPLPLVRRAVPAALAAAGLTCTLGGLWLVAVTFVRF